MTKYAGPIILWVPPTKEDWPEASFWMGVDLPYESFKKQIEGLISHMMENDYDLTVFRISAPAMKARMDELGLPYDSSQSAHESICEVLGSPFPGIEQDLEDIARRNGFKSWATGKPGRR